MYANWLDIGGKSCNKYMIDDVGTSNPDPCGCSMLPLYIIYTILCMFEVYNGITKFLWMEWFGVKEKEGTSAMQTFLHLHGMVFLAFVWLLMLAMIRTYQKLGDCIYLRIFFETKKHKEKLYKVQSRFCFSWNWFWGVTCFFKWITTTKKSRICAQLFW